MRTIFNSLITVLIALLISCDSGNTSDITTKNYIVERGGCADGLPPDGVILDEKPDTLYHYIIEDTLTIYIGFNENCCFYYDDFASIAGDDIDLVLNLQSNKGCFCMCYYEFNFKFIEFEKKEYNYSVKVDGELKFSGKIDLSK